jgi:hypothetical protein
MHPLLVCQTNARASKYLSTRETLLHTPKYTQKVLRYAPPCSAFSRHKPSCEDSVWMGEWVQATTSRASTCWIAT